MTNRWFGPLTSFICAVVAVSLAQPYADAQEKLRAGGVRVELGCRLIGLDCLFLGRADLLEL